MDFTEVYKHSGANVSFSHGSHLILTAVHDRLVLRRADTFQIMRTWRIDASPTPTHLLTTVVRPKNSSQEHLISHIGWSCDSEYVLAASAKLGAVQIFKVQDPEWSARIECGAEGLVKAQWAPDGRTVLCFSQWGLRVTVWSLVSGTAIYIQFPLHPDTGYAFRADGRYFVLAERHKSRDTIGVYDTEQEYKLVRHFPSPTSSLAALALSPKGDHLAVWEGPTEYKLCVLSLTGSVLGTFCPEPDPGLGIRRVAWHPSGMFLAVSGWDDKIHILDLTWTAAVTFELLSRVPAGVTIWREPSRWQEATEGRGFLSYERLTGSHSIVVQKPDSTKPNPKSGTVQMEWNASGTLLLVRFESSPTVVHLFNFPASGTPRLRSVLIHTRPVAHARWNPARKGNLVLCCGSRSLYSWSDEWQGQHGEEEMAECIGVPAKSFETRDLRWTLDGKGVVLLDKEVFCCAFEVDEPDP